MLNFLKTNKESDTHYPLGIFGNGYILDAKIKKTLGKRDRIFLFIYVLLLAIAFLYLDSWWSYLPLLFSLILQIFLDWHLVKTQPKTTKKLTFKGNISYYANIIPFWFLLLAWISVLGLFTSSIWYFIYALNSKLHSAYLISEILTVIFFSLCFFNVTLMLKYKLKK